MSRQLILDVDTGTDDAVAIMFAALHPELDLLGLPTSPVRVPAGASQPDDVLGQTLAFSVREPLVEMGSGQVFVHELLHVSAPQRSGSGVPVTARGGQDGGDVVGGGGADHAATSHLRGRPRGRLRATMAPWTSS